MAEGGSRISYRDAGVDIDAGDALVERIGAHVKRTLRPEVLTDLGGFAGLCAIPTRYREPLLVSCTDGVGTKLKLAFLTGKHDTVGVDLVAMNVNDLIVGGAEPLFFLDYFASGKLDVGVAERVIAGIADGCRQAGCALLGGETAELPGFYAAGARWIRFAEVQDPSGELERLLKSFVERFGSLPISNAGAGRRATQES